MNLRSKLFKKPWQNRDPALRARAVQQDNDPALLKELPQIAQEDESANVRLAALKRLNSEPFWLDARLREKDTAIIEAADQFLGREVVRTDRQELEDARIEWLNLSQDGELIRRLATRSPAVALRRAALARISAQGFLGDCFIQESDDELAADLLARIDQLSTLERVVQQARRSNKRRAQAAAQRLDALRVAAGKAAPGQADSERLVDEAEALARGHGRGELAAALSDLRTRWAQLADHPEALTRRFEGALRIIEATLQRREKMPEAPPPSAELSEVGETPEAEGPDAQLLGSADYIRSSIRKGASVDARELLAHWDRTWNQIPTRGPAEDALKAEMLPLLRELQAQVQMQNQTQARKAQGPETAAGKAKQSAADFAARLDAVGESLEAGDLARAHDLLRALRSEHDRLPARQRSSLNSGRLQRMEGRLKEMRNWQHWSNNKIRDQLISQVQQLTESGQHPDAIMAGLKQAREEWKRLEALEILPGDKRKFAAPPGQWRQFQAACKQAYKTSKPFLEKRQQLLEQNLEALKAFIEAGRKAAADEGSQTGDLLGFMRKARQAIRRMDDLPPKARGSSAAALRELMNEVSNALDQRFEAIESVKRRLVAEARALSHEKDLKSAVDKAKALQGQWQKAGSGRRKIEQELWRQFREPIDPLFEQLKGELDQRRQADHEAQAELKSLCQQAEALADQPDEELERARGQLLGLVDEWLRHEHRPESLNRRFERAEQRIERRIAEQQAKQRQRSDAQAQDLAELIQTLWTLRQEGDNDDLASRLPPQAPPHPAGEALLELAGRLADPAFECAELQAQVESNLELGRQIAVEFEFLSGLETPAADQSLRMDYQVQRLARRMSEREHQPDLASEMEQLQERWYQCLPLPPSDFQALQGRIAKAQGVLRNMVGQ